jgi:multiple sugar transport system substrate-binding protein
MRLNLFASTLIGAAFILSSCADDGAKNVNSVRTVRFWQFWSDASQRAVLDSLIDEFERANACTVEVTNLLWNDGKSKLQAAFNSGAPPDVIELGSDWIAQFSSAGVLRSLASDSAGIARFVPYAMPPAMWNGKVYAYPWTIDTRVMYVNTTLVPTARDKAVPLGMSDVLVAARATQARGKNGIGINGADRHRLYKKILPMMWSFGGDIFDAQGRPVINSPQNIQALTMYADMSRVGMVETQRQLDAAFWQGNVAFWNSG